MKNLLIKEKHEDIVFWQKCLKLIYKEIIEMKARYEIPEMDVIGFESEDIITTSGVQVGGDPDVEGPEVDFEEW